MHHGCKDNHQVLLSCWQPSLGEEQHPVSPTALRSGEGDASKHPESSVPLLRGQGCLKEAEAVQEGKGCPSTASQTPCMGNRGNSCMINPD